MNNNVVLFGKIAAKSFIGWMKIITGGSIVSIAGLVTAIVLWHNNAVAGFAGSGTGSSGAVPGFLHPFLYEFWTALLFFGSLGAIVFYASLASKYGIQKAMYLTWDYKMSDLFAVRLDKYLSRIFGSRQKEAALPMDASRVKQALGREIKQDPEQNRIQRRIFQYLLRRIRLDDINFSDPQPDVRNIMIRKLKALISDRIEPSLLPFGIGCGIHLVVLVLALLYDHH